LIEDNVPPLYTTVMWLYVGFLWSQGTAICGIATVTGGRGAVA